MGLNLSSIFYIFACARQTSCIWIIFKILICRFCILKNGWKRVYFSMNHHTAFAKMSLLPYFPRVCDARSTLFSISTPYNSNESKLTRPFDTQKTTCLAYRRGRKKKTERRAIHVFCMQRISWKIVFNYGRIRIFNGSYSAWSNVDGLFAITMTTSSSPIYVNILTIWCRKISRHKDAKFRLKSSVKINAHRTPSN